MSTTQVRGKDVLIKQIPAIIYNAFTDMRNLVNALPEEYKSKVEVDYDSIRGEKDGISLGIRVVERSPYSKIRLEAESNSPFPFSIELFFDPVGDDSTTFHIELAAELNFMMKMVLGSKLQTMVDRLSDQIESALANK